MKRRSKEPWERGRGAPKKGNPRYMPVMRNGRKVYVVRPRKSGYKMMMGKKMKKTSLVKLIGKVKKYKPRLK